MSFVFRNVFQYLFEAIELASCWEGIVKIRGDDVVALRKFCRQPSCNWGLAFCPRLLRASFWKYFAFGNKLQELGVLWCSSYYHRWRKHFWEMYHLQVWIFELIRKRLGHPRTLYSSLVSIIEAGSHCKLICRLWFVFERSMSLYCHMICVRCHVIGFHLALLFPSSIWRALVWVTV